MSNRVVTSSSSGSSSSSFSSKSVLPQTPRRNMDEVWKEISLNSTLQQDIPSTPSFLLHHQQQLQHHQHHHRRHESFTAAMPTTNSAISLRGITLQDFLSGPLKQPRPLVMPQEPQPPTALSLHCGQLLGYISPNSNGSSSDLSSSDAVSGSSADFSKKRLPEKQFNQSKDDAIDHHKKRLIKNRESAARSRARKQAYTRELELEVAKLTSENRRIKRQYEELLMKMTALAPVTAKPKLQRTLTAPL